MLQPTIEIQTKQPTRATIVERTSSQSLSTIYYEFTKIPQVVVKHYVVKISGWSVPNVPFSRTQIVIPGFNGVRQSVKIKDLESGYQYKVKALAVYHDNQQSLWSTDIAASIRKFTIILQKNKLFKLFLSKHVGIKIVFSLKLNFRLFNLS